MDGRDRDSVLDEVLALQEWNLQREDLSGDEYQPG
jgi:hypothetical protein